jgi:hypothetical protein
MNKNKRGWLLLAISVVFLLVAVVAFQLRSGIQVTVENTGTSPLKSVELYVTGRSYELGDIAPEESATARVNPIGESELEVEFKDTDGQTQRLNAGGYFESGYRGSIQVEIKDGQIDKFEDNTKSW